MAGDIESLKEMMAFNRAQPSANAEDVENDECPHCWIPLKINSKGQKACPMCGTVYK